MKFTCWKNEKTMFYFLSKKIGNQAKKKRFLSAQVANLVIVVGGERSGKKYKPPEESVLLPVVSCKGI